MSSLEKGRQWQRALDLLNEMRSPMNLLQPDVITYNAAISAAEKGLQWESALCLLQEMLTKGPAPNIISFNAAISALEKAELWERALALLEDAATRAGISADLITYSAIISALGRGQQWQAAMGLLVQLRTSKLQPSLVTYNAAVSAAERASEWRIALQLLFAEIRPRGMEPDIITYNSAVSATSRVHRWQLAHSIFRSMRQRPGGPAPDHITYNAAIAASETGQQAELVLELLREMTSLSLSPGPSVRSRAVLACLGAGLWSQALEILDELLRKGLSGFGSGGTGGTVGLAEKVASLESFSEDENTASDASNFKGLPLRCAADKEFCASLQACVGPLLSACETRDFCKQELALLHLLAWRPAPDEDNTLHEDSLDYDELLSLLAAAGRNAAASRLLARGRHKQAIALISYHKSHATVSDAASAAGVVTACLQAAAHGEAATGYVAANPWRGRLVQSIPARRPYARELSMLRHVLARARPGDAAAVCEAIEHFGEKVMGSAGMWSKFAGGSKSACLVAASSGSMASSGGVLEIGTYCGYSAIKLASALAGSHITSLEVDPTMVVIARNLVALAGLALQVDVRTGHTQTMLPQLAAERPTVPHSFGVVFMDRWGSQYEEDRLLLERHRLLMPGAVIVADNILSTGAALFLWSCVTPVARPQFGLAGSLPAYHTQVLQVKEVGSGSGVEVCEDWMSVSVTRAFSDFKADPALNHSPTADVVELHAASERMRELAFGPGRSVTFKERAVFTAKMRKGLELLLAGRL
ncbi:unnamed protein product [Polarella glacialis]|uniref:Catechol O-methyltransferase n=1 Tax=Polarella glacialis TaxID=89957 RepID=A0A813HMU2_POLGL|nr:unnamed protein product [Polarella glacialis]